MDVMPRMKEGCPTYYKFVNTYDAVVMPYMGSKQCCNARMPKLVLATG